MRKTSIVFCLLICLSPFAFADKLPIEAFASLPEISKVSLSPDGSRLVSVIRMTSENVKGTGIQVTELATNKKKLVLFTDNVKYDINWVKWKGNNILLVGYIFPEKRNSEYSGRLSKTRETRMMIIDVDADKITSAFSRQFLSSFGSMPAGQDNVIDFLSEDNNHVLVTLYGNAYELDVKSNTTHLVQGKIDNPYVYDWMTDDQHRIRIAYAFKDGINSILTKDINTNKWRELWSYKEFSSDEVQPAGFALDPNILYIKAYHEGYLALFEVNLQDEKLTRKLIYSTPNYDVDGSLIYSKATKEVIGITSSDGNGIIFFDPEFKKLQSNINKALPNTKNFIYSLSDDNQKYIVFSYSDVEAGNYFIGDRKNKSLNFIASPYKLPAELMSPKKPFNYKARDGLEIEAWLSLPIAAQAKKLPTIILPHGGPISQDDDGFDYWVQFLTSRGYAVLQMNFRGSSGRGLKFRNAGLKNWGLEMQDDVEDGARKLIADGITDEKRTCILGASYGGYAALEGIVKTPDLYKCAVSVAGVSNVYDLVKDERAFWLSYNVVDEQIGNDNKHLREISPVNYAEKIKVPVLLIHGDSDRQVDIKHSKQMRDALVKAGKNVTYVELPSEDHYLTNNENRIKTFEEIDKFLEKNL